MPVTISASKGEAILTLGQAVGAGKRVQAGTYRNGQTSWQHTRPSKSQSRKCFCQSSLWPGRCPRGPRGPEEESHVTLSCVLYPNWDAWAKHLSTTLSDHLSSFGHLKQGINSGRAGVSALILLVKN